MAMTKTQVVKELAEEVGVSKKQAGIALEALTKMAYREAKNGFTLPGIGKLVVADRKARMGRNPKTGESIQIPAKRVLKFRVAKAAKESIL
jgi:DNA-binding protein HU-beta